MLAKRAQHERAQRLAIIAYRFRYWLKLVNAISEYREQRRLEEEKRKAILDALTSDETDFPLRTTSQRFSLLHSSTNAEQDAESLLRVHEPLLETVNRTTSTRSMLSTATFMEEKRRKEAWSPLPLAQLVYDTLLAHNPEAPELYWKIAVNADESEVKTWLAAKLSGSNASDELWCNYRTELCNGSSYKPIYCCVSTSMTAGTQAMIVVVNSASMTPDLFKVTSACNAQKPTLVLAVGDGDAIQHELLQRKLRNTFVIDYSDDLAQMSRELTRGIQWLAEHAPPQPVLTRTHIKGINTYITQYIVYIYI